MKVRLPDRLVDGAITVVAAVWRRVPHGEDRRRRELQLVAELYGRPSRRQRVRGVVRMARLWVVEPMRDRLFRRAR